MSDQENLRGNVEDHIAEMLSHDQSKLGFAFMFTGYITDSGDLESRMTAGITSSGAPLLHATLKGNPDILSDVIRRLYNVSKKEED